MSHHDARRRPGPLPTARRLAGRTARGLLHAHDRLVTGVADRRLGIETGAPVDLAGLDLSDPEFRRYEATDWRGLRRLLRVAPVRSGDVFLDLGSGKGRVVIQAARAPFARVVGVELAPQLTDVARRNVARALPAARAADVELVTANATTYAIPDDVTHLYLFNPFVGETLDRAMANVIASFDRRPRELRILYMNPVEHERLRRMERLRVRTVIHTPALARLLTGGPPFFAAVYEVVPAAAGSA
jgi:SAM-dependent methyltransferase